MRFLSVVTLMSLLLAYSAHARKTNFLENHQGLTLGAGTYWTPLTNQNTYDPVPQLVPSGSTVSGSRSSYLLPAKIGYFRELGRSALEVYARYMINTSTTWSTSGGIDQDGKTRYKSYGAGLLISGTAARYASFRLNVAASAEYILQRATLTSLDENLSLSGRSILLGPSLQTEFYLGDLWVLSLHTGYHYGFPGNEWSAVSAATFLGQSVPKGALSSLGNGTVKSDFGGFFAEVNFKLLLY